MEAQLGVGPPNRGVTPITGPTRGPDEVQCTLNRATQKTDDGRKRHPLKAAVGERRRQHQVRMLCSVRTTGGNGCSRLLKTHAEAASFQYQPRQDRDDAPRQPTPCGSQMSHAGVQTGDRKRESCSSSWIQEGASRYAAARACMAERCGACIPSSAPAAFVFAWLAQRDSRQQAYQPIRHYRRIFR